MSNFGTEQEEFGAGELGANIGSKLRSIRELRPDFVQDVIEIHHSAARKR